MKCFGIIVNSFQLASYNHKALHIRCCSSPRLASDHVIKLFWLTWYCKIKWQTKAIISQGQTILSKLNEDCVLIMKILNYMYKEIEAAWALKCLFSTLPQLITSTLNVLNKRNAFFICKFQFYLRFTVSKFYGVEFINWSCKNNFFIVFNIFSVCSTCKTLCYFNNFSHLIHFLIFFCIFLLLYYHNIVCWYFVFRIRFWIILLLLT